MNDIVVALGGGGVKGHAHIGVLRVLEREGFHIRGIAGTSAGGLWGSFFALGLSPDEIQERMTGVDAVKLYTRRPEDGPAVMGVHGIEQLLRSVYADCSFRDLKLPFAVTAVDLDSAEAVVMRHGALVEALLATIAVPGIFPPAHIGGRMLIDGGILNPVPVSVARALVPGIPVVAVVLSPRLSGWAGRTRPRLLNSLPFISNYLGRLRLAQAFNIFMRSVDIAGAMLTELRLELEQPEVVIRPNVPHVGLIDPVDVAEVVRLGEEAAEAALPALHRAVGWQSRLIRRIFRQGRQEPRMPLPIELTVPPLSGSQNLLSDNGTRLLAGLRSRGSVENGKGPGQERAPHDS